MRLYHSTSFAVGRFYEKRAVLTSGDESSKEHSKSVMAVTTESQEDAYEDEDKASNDTLPGQAGRCAVTQQVVQHVWLSLAIVVAVYYKKRVNNGNYLVRKLLLALDIALRKRRKRRLTGGTLGEGEEREHEEDESLEGDHKPCGGGAVGDGNTHLFED